MIYLLDGDDKVEVIYIVSTKRTRARCEGTTKYGRKGDDNEKYGYVICPYRASNCSNIIGQFNK